MLGAADVRWDAPRCGDGAARFEEMFGGGARNIPVSGAQASGAQALQQVLLFGV